MLPCAARATAAAVSAFTSRQSQCSTSYLPAQASKGLAAKRCKVSRLLATLSSTLSVLPLPSIPSISLADLSYVAPPLERWGSDTFLTSGCEIGTKLRVAVLLSGGVDSSLSLKLLKAAGHHCKAFYLQIWFQEDFRNFWDACPWEEDLKYAQQVCDQLGVELELVPLTKQYWDRVVAHCVAEIKQGRTPNPDILCNSRVKFGAFYEHLEQHHAAEFDRVASGHYARVVREGGRAARLALTPDAVKDQTYFLANLTQEQLARVMFPIGGLTKAQVRQLAAAAGLANQSRKDSQGICFLGKVKFTEFVKEHLGECPGFLVEAETDRKLGMHQGFWFFTVGQRGGIKLPDGPWYVVRKDVRLNIVYVSKQYYSQDKQRNAFIAGPFSWLGTHRPDPHRPLFVKVRHGPRMYGCSVTWHGSGGQPGTSNGGSWVASLPGIGQHQQQQHVGGTGTQQQQHVRDVGTQQQQHVGGIGTQQQQNVGGIGTQQQQHVGDPRGLVSAETTADNSDVGSRNGHHDDASSLRHSSALAITAAVSGSSAAAVGGTAGAGGGAHGHDSALALSSGVFSSTASLSAGRSTGSAGHYEYATIVLDANDQGIAAGQYAVLYQDGFCLGAAQIQLCLDTEADAADG